MPTTVHARRLPVTAQRAFEALCGMTDRAEHSRLDWDRRVLVSHSADGTSREWEVRSDGLACQVLHRTIVRGGPARMLRWLLADRRAHHAETTRRLDELRDVVRLSRSARPAGAAR